MSRTNDKAFFECPLCDRKPYIKKKCDHSAKVYCKGGLFNRHKELSIEIIDEREDRLYKSLSSAWNQLQFEEVRNLPIKKEYIAIEEFAKMCLEAKIE